MDNPIHAEKELGHQIAERLDIARDFLRRVKTDTGDVEGDKRRQDFQLNMMSIAAFVCADGPGLYDFDDELDETEPAKIVNYLQSLESFLARFLRRDLPPTTKSSTKRSLRVIYREQLVALEKYFSESKKAQDRHGHLCAVTQSRLPVSCHYWPFRSNWRPDDVAALREAILRQDMLFDKYPKPTLADLVAPENGEKGSSNRDWNMICLHPLLEKHWGDGNPTFGLRWLDCKKKDPDPEFMKVAVEWNWMPSNIEETLDPKYINEPEGILHPGQKTVDLECDETREALKDALVETLMKPRAFRVRNNANPSIRELKRWLHQGQIIPLRIKKVDLSKLKTAVEARWRLLQIASLSGAAEAPELLSLELPTIPQVPLDANFE